MPLIEIDEIKNQVEQRLQHRFTWLYTQETGSTNSDLLALNQANSIAITENQTQGRGQRKNEWHASSQNNLLFSIAIEAQPNERLGLLPIKAGLAIHKTLNQLGFQNIELKWPNDIFFQGQKVGGILVESITQNNKMVVVIGVGLNVNKQSNDPSPFIALNHNLKQTIDRSKLLADCLCGLFKLWDLNDICHEFNQVHLFDQRHIRFTSNQTIIEGVCKGIDEWGQLLIETQDTVKAYSSGSIIMDRHVSA